MSTAATQGLATRLRRVLEDAAADPMVPGVIAAIHAPRIGLRWSDAVPGVRAGSDVTWHADLPFRIASVTKLFVAAAVMRLVENGRLSLDAPIATLITQPTSRVLMAGGHDPLQMTVSHLLTHTSGLPDHTHSDDYVADVKTSPVRVWTRLEQLQIAASMQRIGERPGQRFEYSDTGYVLLGEIIERSTGNALGPAVRDLTGIDSLGLQRTHWEQHEIDPADGERALQYIGDIDATNLDPSFDLHGGGGLVSTVNDLCLFMRALIHGRVFKSTGTLAAALTVPAAERAADAYIHSRLAMVLPAGPSWGWGHLGYWGCGVWSCADLDITVASTINQPEPVTSKLRRDLIGELGALVAAAQRDESISAA